jgi:hypothetical protein
MPDMNALFPYSPELSGYFAGQNQANYFQEGQLKNQELAQKIAQQQAQEARTQELFPIEKRGKELGNKTVEAELTGKEATSSKQALEYQSLKALQPSSIQAGIAKNQELVAGSDAETLAKGQDIMMRFGAQLSTVPVPLRRQALQGMIEQQGLNPKAKHLAALMTADPEQMPFIASSLADQLGSQAMSASSQARSHIAATEISTGGHIEGQRIAAAAHVEGMRLAAAGRVEAAHARMGSGDLLAKLMSGQVPPDRAATAAAINEQLSTDPDAKAFWHEVGRQAEQLMKEKPQAGQQGNLTVDPNTGKLTPKEVGSVFDQRPAPAGATPGGAPAPKNPSPNQERVQILQDELVKAQKKLLNPRAHVTEAEAQKDPNLTDARDRFQRDVLALQHEIAQASKEGSVGQTKSGTKYQVLTK